MKTNSFIEAKRQASRRWRQNNKEKAKALVDAWKQLNPGKQEQKTKEWKQKYPEWQREHYRKARYKRIKYREDLLKKSICVHCGFKNYKGLEWAHKKGQTKIKSVGAWASWKGMLAEIKRCFVLCATCHRIYDWKDKEKRRELQRKTAMALN